MNVPITKCPVSAAVIAKLIVSRSLISPTRIISGSSLMLILSAFENDLVSSPTSLCLTRQFLFSKTNSIGSSIVSI